MRTVRHNQLVVTPLVAAVSLLVGFTLSFNAAAGLFDDEEARRELKNLRAQTEQQNRDNEARFLKLDESIKNIGVIQLLNQIEQLNDEISKLRGQIEVLSNQNDQLTKRQKDFYLDIDSRLRKLEGVPPDITAPASISGAALAGAGVSVGGTSGAVSSGAAQTPRPFSKDQENKAYDVGSNLFRRGDYVAAIRAFETFIKDFPGSGLVSNAQYWVGISFFNMRDYASARSAQEALLRKFPDAAKAPDALLAIASIQIESGDNGSARNTLEEIIARFPNSEAATKARMRLTQTTQLRR